MQEIFVCAFVQVMSPFGASAVMAEDAGLTRRKKRASAAEIWLIEKQLRQTAINFSTLCCAEFAECWPSIQFFVRLLSG